jgi:hypothetical protein
VGVDRLEQRDWLTGGHPYFLPGRPEVEIAEVAMRATDVEEIDLRIHRQARATIRAHRVKLRDRELKQQARPESAERLGDDDPETVQPRPVREDRFRTDPLAADVNLERLDKNLVGDMHSRSPLSSFSSKAEGFEVPRHQIACGKRKRLSGS